MRNLQSVLVVDDDRQSRNLLAELLREDCRVILAGNGEQAMERARTLQPDLILLDILMPGMDGYEVIQILKQEASTCNIPVILISALDSLADEERGLDLGAVDYISKPFHPPIARKRVYNHLQSVRYRRLLENMAMLDALTEIPNRRRYDTELEAAWQHCMASQHPLSLLLIDADHFKGYNDQLGHASGDAALRQLVEVLGSVVRPTGSLLARYGGEEFVVLLPGVPSAAAWSMAEAMRAAIEQKAIVHPETGRLTISVGGACCVPVAGLTPSEIFNRADAALYQAKAAGRNRVCWQPSTD